MITAISLIEKFKEALRDNWGYIYATAGELWTAAKQAELEKTTDSSRANGRLYGKKWIGHKVADCSGLFSWAFKALGGAMYHGSNTMYRKWCTDHGELKNGLRTDGKVLLPGTAVFVWDGSTYSHVGLFIGDGTVIEAQGTKAGVTTSKLTASKWRYWGELLGVDYDGTVSEAAAAHPMIRKGNRGDAVIELQNKLARLGYYLGKSGVDGDFGKDTEKAVKEFQEDRGLTVDGVVGPATWEALDKATATKPVVRLYTVHIPHLTADQAAKLVGDYPGAYKIEE